MLTASYSAQQVGTFIEHQLQFPDDILEIFVIEPNPGLSETSGTIDFSGTGI